jgi:hypothetical protein
MQVKSVFVHGLRRRRVRFPHSAETSINGVTLRVEINRSRMFIFFTRLINMHRERRIIQFETLLTLIHRRESTE